MNNDIILKTVLSRIAALSGQHAKQHSSGSGCSQTASAVLAAIDGRCCSGKTTLAMQLCEALIKQGIACSVIHMDDFFLRPEQRTPERLAEPGGNIDYERFTTEILDPLSRGSSFMYQPYNCRRQELGAPISVKPTQVTLIEGSYSCHPHFRGTWDLHIFMTVEKEQQLSRIEKRNGVAALPMFREKWIPMEEHYFQTYKIKENSDLLFDTTQY